MQRDVACCWCQQQRDAEQTSLFSVKPKPLRDVVSDRSHGRERGILHDHEKHGMTKQREKRRKQQNDGLKVVAEQRNGFDRNLKTPVNELPDRLDIVGQVERPIFKVRPTGVRRPCAYHKKQCRHCRDHDLAGWHHRRRGLREPGRRGRGRIER